jgi:predicted metal-dependent enzyme (double-stranded beta helix superfamily)
METEYILDTPRVRAFIAEVYATLAAHPVAEALELLRPTFADLLADPNWLPETFMLPAEDSKMGGGIASWVIFRAADGGLSLFSLVVPPNSATPVHDHLAWGLVGLYAGEQDERVYRRLPDAPDHIHAEDHAHLELTEQNHLRPGDFYVLMPPEGDIHSVATISRGPSVSIHLLGNDTGCTWRHAYNPDASTVRAFKSGWSNVECNEEEVPST